MFRAVQSHLRRHGIAPLRLSNRYSSSSRTTSGRGKIYSSVLDTIGDTPTIQVTAPGLVPNPEVNMFVKAEFFNPASSVKDRLAASILEEAERSGALKEALGRLGQEGGCQSNPSSSI